MDTLQSCCSPLKDSKQILRKFSASAIGAMESSPQRKHSQTPIQSKRFKQSSTSHQKPKFDRRNSSKVLGFLKKNEHLINKTLKFHDKPTQLQLFLKRYDSSLSKHSKTYSEKNIKNNDLCRDNQEYLSSWENEKENIILNKVTNKYICYNNFHSSSDSEHDISSTSVVTDPLFKSREFLKTEKENNILAVTSKNHSFSSDSEKTDDKTFEFRNNNTNKRLKKLVSNNNYRGKLTSTVFKRSWSESSEETYLKNTKLNKIFNSDIFSENSPIVTDLNIFENEEIIISRLSQAKSTPKDKLLTASTVENCKHKKDNITHNAFSPKSLVHDSNIFSNKKDNYMIKKRIKSSEVTSTTEQNLNGRIKKRSINDYFKEVKKPSQIHSSKRKITDVNNFERVNLDKLHKKHEKANIPEKKMVNHFKNSQESLSPDWSRKVHNRQSNSLITSQANISLQGSGPNSVSEKFNDFLEISAKNKVVRAECDSTINYFNSSYTSQTSDVKSPNSSTKSKANSTIIDCITSTFKPAYSRNKKSNLNNDSHKIDITQGTNQVTKECTDLSEEINKDNKDISTKNNLVFYKFGWLKDTLNKNDNLNKTIFFTPIDCYETNNKEFENKLINSNIQKTDETLEKSNFKLPKNKLKSILSDSDEEPNICPRQTEFSGINILEKIDKISNFSILKPTRSECLITSSNLQNSMEDRKGRHTTLDNFSQKRRSDTFLSVPGNFSQNGSSETVFRIPVSFAKNEKEAGEFGNIPVKSTPNVEKVQEKQIFKDDLELLSELQRFDNLRQLYQETNACEITHNKSFNFNIPETKQSSSNLNTQPLEQKSVENHQNKKIKKTYNISPDCLLHEDNMLSYLVGEKQKIVRGLDIKKSAESEEIPTSCYIKRYNKGDTKIYKIRTRYKKTKCKLTKPEENWEKILSIIEDRVSDSESIEKERVSTPTSYKTDDTRSEVLSTGSGQLTIPQKMLRSGVNKTLRDRNLIFTNNDDIIPTEFNRDQIRRKICEILLDAINGFKENKINDLKWPADIMENCVFKDNRYQLSRSPRYALITYQSKRRRVKYNLTLLILNKIRELLQNKTKLTKREIFYQLKPMVSDQRTTDRVIHEISRMLGVGMWALNIIAYKGLVFGNMRLVLSTGEVINCNVPGTQIPADVTEITEIQSTAFFILVVEKDSIFNKLIEEDLPNRLTRPFILITGKGFPDLNTQMFVKKLWMTMSVPVFILVDPDPHGVGIMINYRFGSVANSHLSHHLALPKSRWLGVFPSEIQQISLPAETLTEKDVKMVNKLLSLDCVKQNPHLEEELKVMLEKKVKASIEGLVKNDTYLSNVYLSGKFYNNRYI